MGACERCWAEYRLRSSQGEDVTYSDVLSERERSGKLCSTEEQCGDLHLRAVVGGRCLCGKVGA